MAKGVGRKVGRKVKKPTFKKWKANNSSGAGTCAERKVKNLMRQNGMTRAEAMTFRHRQMTRATA